MLGGEPNWQCSGFIYFCFCIQSLFLKGIRGSYKMLGIKSTLGACKTSMLSVILSLWPLNLTFCFLPIGINFASKTNADYLKIESNAVSKW